MTTDAVGGVWQYSIDLAAALAGSGWRTTLAVLGPQPSPEQKRQIETIAGAELVMPDLPLDWLAKSAHSVERAATELAALAQQIEADLAHCNAPAYAGAAEWPVPVVAAAHGCVATWWDDVRQSPLDAAFDWHRELVRRGLLAADAVIAPSRAFAETLRRTYTLPFTPAAVHNGRHTRPVASAAHPAAEALTAGRLWDAAKNAIVLDRAAAAAKTPILAAGALRGPHGETFAPAHLQALGQVDEAELAALLARRPVFVSAATFEPFGLAVLEAAAAGCALVLSDIPTFRELWGGAAVFVPAADAAGFARAVDTIAADAPRRDELGRKAAARASRYTPEACAAQTAAIYDRLLARQEVAA